LITTNLEYLADDYLNDSVYSEPNFEMVIKSSLVKKVYPNPFTDYIIIEMNEIAVYGFQIFDMNGKRIKTSKLKTDHIKMELPNLKPGYYILKVIAEDFEILDEIKLVKK